MKRTLSVILVAVLVCTCLAGCGAGSNPPAATPSAAPAEATPAPASSSSGAEIKMATGGQDTLPSYATVLDVLNDLRTNDNIDIKYFGARQLGEDAEILQQVMAGTIQMGGGSAAIFSNYTDLFNGIQIPFLITDYETERTAMQYPEAQAIFDAVCEATGIKILAVYDAGMRYFANNVRPITKLEDVKGLKLRVVPTDLLIESFNAMGANPSNLGYGELYTGLQNGTIDGEEINVTSIYSEKHYEVLKYFTDGMGIYAFPNVMYCNADWFNSLPQEQQDALVNAFSNGYNYLFDKHLPEAEAAGREAMANANIEISTVENPQEFIDAVSGVVESYRNKNELFANFIDMVEGLKE